MNLILVMLVVGVKFKKTMQVFKEPYGSMLSETLYCRPLTVN